jgi:ABC-type uncharacterized transport system substrate-binding protein
VIRRKTALCALVLLAVAIVGRVAAHPHIWIDSRVEILVSDDRVDAVRAHWTFDPFFTEMILLDFGRARDGRFSDAQISAIRDGAFQNLRHFGYFTTVRVDGNEIPIERVENFHAYIDDEGDLVYQFDIPLGLALGERDRSIAVAMYDETFFTDMVFRENYALVHGAQRLSYETELTRELYQVPIWGPMNRETVYVRLRRDG